MGYWTQQNTLLKGMNIYFFSWFFSRFERLGPDYDLGRLAIAEIEEYRTDKQRKKPI